MSWFYVKLPHLSKMGNQMSSKAHNSKCNIQCSLHANCSTIWELVPLEALSGCAFMFSNKMLLLGAMEIKGGKNSHSKYNTFLPSDRSTFAHLVQMLPYSCGCKEKYRWEARSQKKFPFCLRAEKDNCSSELTQDASLPFQWQHKLRLHSWEKSYVDLLSFLPGCLCV